MAKEYWYCTAGPIDPDTYEGNGADAPLRMAVRNALERHFSAGDYTLASGWGVTRSQVDEMSFSSCDEKTKKAIIKSRIGEGKKLPRHMQAWAMLFNKDETNTEEE